MFIFMSGVGICGRSKYFEIPKPCVYGIHYPINVKNSFLYLRSEKFTINLFISFSRVFNISFLSGWVSLKKYNNIKIINIVIFNVYISLMMQSICSKINNVILSKSYRFQTQNIFICIWAFLSFKRWFTWKKEINKHSCSII